MRAALLVPLLLASCAALYRPPKVPQAVFARTLSASRAEVFDATKRALIVEGYTIQESDRSAGTISTSARPHRLTADDADCGTTVGLPYIKDKRTSTTVAIGVLVGDGTLTITPSIHGEYLRADVTQSIAFDCASKGTLEEALYRDVLAQLPK